MQSAALPFRPRAVAPDAAVESLALQAADGRARMNRVALVHALSLAASALLASFALLVLLAPRLSPSRFAVITWMLLAASAGVATAAFTRLRRAWVRRSEAAAVIDHRVALEDRLTTLLSVGADARESRLWNHLRDENLRLKPRWTPAALVPRLVPWGAWLLIASLALASLASWGAWRGPRPGPRAATLVASRPDPRAASEGDGAADSPGAGSEGSTWSSLPEELQQAILGSPPSQEQEGSAPRKTQGVENEIPGAASLVDRSMSVSGPRRSVPSTPDASRMAGPPAAGRASRPAPDPDKPKQGAGAPAPAAPMQGDGPKLLAPDKGKALSPQDKALQKKMPSPIGEGGTGHAGAGSGGDKDGLFGERQAVGAAGGSFSLDLDAMRGREDGKQEGDGSSNPRADSALAPNQRVDDAIRRAQVPAEYEAIVQRLFNRSDDADRPQGTR